MTAHKHAAMIKAKADNMDLVVLRKHYEGDWVEVADQGEIRIKQSGEYFLCLPQHKEACLHWLNGLDIEYQDFPTSEWSIIENRGACSWGFDVVFMQEEFNIRIKPRKENRWVIVDVKTNNTSFAYSNKEVALGDFKCAGSSSQLIEIEVEI